MKAILFLLWAGTLSLWAGNVHSQDATINISNYRSLTIDRLINEVEAQTDYLFVYSKSDIDVHATVSLSTRQMSVKHALDAISSSVHISYVFDNDYIILTKKDLAAESLPVMQSNVVKGRITDKTGEPVPGVNVIVKGSLTGTITDSDGKYSINVPDAKTILVYSFVGYATHEFQVGDQTQIDIILEEDSREIEEVVVVGYGTQKKVNVIGSVSQVTGEKLENRTVPLLSNALAGQMTGVTVIQRSGKPGDSPGEIRVRGVGSFEATPDALVLVDGVPGSINDVKPDDVQSISVLKDAATAAIYGARASNGVILITTKMGSDGKLKVNYNGYVGFTRPTEFPDMVNSWEYAAMYNEAVGTNTYDVDKYKSDADRDSYPNSNFLKDVFSRNGFQTGHDISLNGGNKSTQYYLTFGYMDQNGIVEKNNYTRYDMRLNLVTELASRLKLSTWLSGTSSKIEEPAVPGGKDVDRMGGIITNAVRYPAIYAGRLSNGDYGTGPEQNGTPVAWMDSPSFYEAPTFKITGRLRLDYTPIDGLKLSAIGGYNHTEESTKLYRSTMRLNDTRTMVPSYLNEKSIKIIYKTIQALAEYDKIFAQKHDVNILLGYSFEDNINREFNASRDNFPVNDLPYLDVGSADNQKNGGKGEDWAFQSVFGRFKYSYAHKYLAEATVRYDGSSRFPPTKKYAVFPSLAMGWRISEEGFFKDQVSWISNLKLKTSWGKLGNSNISNYPYQNVYSLDAGYVIGDNIRQGGYIASLEDPELHWEETRTTDAGVELGLFKNGLLDISVAYFYRKTEDCLYKPSGNVSRVLGMSVDYANTGSLKNTGWEFEISHRNKVGGFSYNFGGNLSVIQNEVLSLGLGNVTQLNGMVGNGTDLFVGYPMQAYYGYKTDGMFIDQNDIDGYPNQDKVLSKPQPGDLRYVDIAKGKDETQDQVNPDYDRTYLGSRIPKYTFAFNLGVEYKGLDLSAQFYGVAGVKGRLDMYAGYALHSLGNVQRWQMDGRWDPANPQRYNDYPRMELISNQSNNTQLSDFWVLNASYLRLKNLQLGYTIPHSLTDKIKISSLRFYVNMENVFCINSYRQGWDPEINTGGDYYPLLSTFTFGANLRF